MARPAIDRSRQHPFAPIALLSLALLIGVAACDAGSFLEPAEDWQIQTNAISHSFTALGQTLQLEADVLDGSGTPVSGVTLEWISTDTTVATVTSMGLVTAAGTGTAAVVVAALGYLACDTVAIAVEQVPSNEPVGLTKISDQDYSASTNGGWKEELSPNFSIVTEGTAPRSPSKVGRGFFRKGEVTGSLNPFSHRLSGWSAKEVYTEFWFKVSENWQGHSSGTNKIFYLTAKAGNPIYYRLKGVARGPLTFSVQRQTPGANDWESPEGSQRSYSWESTDNEIKGRTEADARVRRGEWVHVEVYVVANTPGNYDGEIHWWLNGTKVGQWTSARFMSENDPFEFNNFRWEPIWGGQGDTVLEDMYQYIDHIYVSGR